MIEIVKIISPESIAEITEREARIKQLEYEIKEREQREKFEKSVAQAIRDTMEEVQNRAKEGCSHYYLEVYKNTFGYQDYPQTTQAIAEEVVKAFKIAGYKGWCHTYSDSWQRRSKKVCCVSIDW